MQVVTVAIRNKLERMEFSEAQAAMVRLVRRAARKRVYEYANRNYIYDFNDTPFVEQVHRNWKDSAEAQGSTLASNVQNATTIEELLTIFDLIVEFL